MVIAFFWFVSMYFKFGRISLDPFLGDQVGVRVAMQMGTVLINLFLAVLLMGFMYFPWVLLGSKNFKSNILSMVDENRAFFGWIILWIISIILMAGMVTHFYERYLLPVVPLTSVGFAWLLTKHGPLTEGKVFKIAYYGLIFLNIVLLIGGLFINLGMDAGWVIYTGLLLGIVAVALLLKKKSPSLTHLALLILLIFYHGSFVTHQISLPHQGDQVAEFVEKKEIPTGSKIAFVGHLHTGSKIRIGLGKEYFMTNLPKDNFLDSLSYFDYVVFEEDIREQLESQPYRIETVSLNWDSKLLWEMVNGILNRDYSKVLEQNGRRYYWGERY
jgi:hypothetical protein